MVRYYIVSAACVFALFGFAAGIAGQIELLKPRIVFMSGEAWLHLLPIHAWITSVSIAIICLSTIALIRDKTTRPQWVIWLGLAIIPLLYGLLLTYTFAKISSGDQFLIDTTFETARRHAYGSVALMIALGGLSAMQSTRLKTIPLGVSFCFAVLISLSATAMAGMQASLGVMGLPRAYIDYPIEFSSLQFYSGIAAIMCLSLSTMYVLLLWRYTRKHNNRIKEMF